MLFMKISRIVSLSPLFVALSLPSMAAAEASESTADTTRWLGEVTVTAIKQKTDLSLQPLAATVIKKDQLDMWSVNSLRNISEIAPNFYMPDYGSRMTSSIYVRGIGSRMDQPAVGMTVDNVPFLNKNGYDFTLVDIDRIEVLRGPQSTLYGRNTMGGQINVYTLKPMDYQGSKVAATIGNGPSANLSVAHYQKLLPQLAMSFAGNMMFTDGFYKNHYNAKKVGAEKGGGLRWTTQWRILPNLQADNTATFNYTQQSGYEYEYAGSGIVNYNDTCFYRRNTISDALTLKWTTSHFTLSSITSFQHITDNLTLDQDFLPLSYFTLTQAIHESSFTQDIVARGKEGRYSWLGGLFGFYKNTIMRAPVTLLDYGIEQLITKNVNDNDRVPVRIEFDNPTLPLQSYFNMPTWGLALYHQSTLDLGRFNFALGLRLDYEKARFDYISMCNTAFSVYMKSGRPPMAIMNKEIAIDDRGRLGDDFLEFVPKFTLSYDLPMQSGSSLYVSVGKGYKSGGYNNQMFSEILQQRMMDEMMSSMPGMQAPDSDIDVDKIISYKPEKSWNYEAGAHIGCADGRVMTDIALFYIDLRDQQLTTFPEGTTTGRITTNAGRTRSFGAEIQLRYTPSTRWNFNASYGYTNAKFRKYIDGNDNYKGNHVPYAPENTLFLSAAFNHKLRNNWKLSYDLNFRGVGRIYWDEANDLSQPFYGLLGASVNADHGWIELEAWMDNITGTKFNTFYFESMQNQFLQRGKPRRFGLTVRLNFNSSK